MLEDVKSNSNLGYNAAKGYVTDLIDDGIIDPTNVVKNSLIYGSSIASIILSADCAVLHHDD